MKFIPLNGRVLLQRLPEETKKGALILTNAEKQDKYYVIAISDDCPVKLGDCVMIEKYSGTEIDLEGEKYLIVKNEHITGFIK